MTIGVDVEGLVAAAQKLFGLATSAQGTLAEMSPLAADPTSGGAAARLDAASLLLWGAACAQAYSLHEAANHLLMVAAKFATVEQRNKEYLLQVAYTQLQGVDDAALVALPPVPPLPPDVRVPMPAGAPMSGEQFAQLVHTGSSANGVGFKNTATANATAIDTAAISVREIAATVPELWESPTGTAALSGRLSEYATNLLAISDRWTELGDQARRHATDYSQTVDATPKPEEFRAVHQQIASAGGIGRSQAMAQLGRLEAQAAAEAGRYAGVTEATTGVGTVQAPPSVGAPAGAGGAGAGAGAAAQAAGAAGQAQQVAKTGATEAAAQTGQAGQGADQLAQMLPQALQSIGGMAGGLAGMAGQVPQQLMQSGQGLMQAAQQGLGGMMGKNATDAELAKKLGEAKDGELPKEGLGAGGAGGGGAGGGVGDTHPAGTLGPPVTPSTSHTPPSMPTGAASPPPTTPTASGGSAMGGMGMPMGGMMPHGAQGAGSDGPDKVAADKKVVTPPQPHTEAVTGRVPDRTAAAAEAARNRADSDTDTDDDPPPRGPILRRITLAPLNDERS
jgi:hypothetical protein